MSETVLITGANRGIGLALSRIFVQAGWQVIACCRNPAAALRLGTMRDASPELLEIHQLDVTNDQQISELAAELAGRSVDILLNNAGILGPLAQQFGPQDEELWLRTFRVNTIAPYKMTVALLDQLARSSRRLIATIGSEMGSLAENSSGGYYVYRSAKAGVHMVMRSLALDLAPRGITAIILHPGWVRTDLGGPEAPVTPADSAAGLFKTMLALEPADSGRFLDYQGKDVAW